MPQWTLEGYVAHNEALRTEHQRFEEERDRRYMEVAAERDRAMRIKEAADKVALELSRETQTYKDMKANELREQISSERGLYATKTDLQVVNEKLDTALRPVMTFISTHQGRDVGSESNRTMIAWIVALILGLIAIGSFVFRPQQTTTYYVPAQPGTLIPSAQERPQ